MYSTYLETSGFSLFDLLHDTAFCGSEALCQITAPHDLRHSQNHLQTANTVLHTHNQSAYPHIMLICQYRCIIQVTVTSTYVLDWHAGWPICGVVFPQSQQELPW